MTYDEYMRSVLGYNMPYAYNIGDSNYEFNPEYNYVNPNLQPNVNTDIKIDLSNLYPEIYKLLNPMVCKICIKNSNREITSSLLEELTEEIYKNFESDEKCEMNQRTVLKNGDVRNPNAKENDILPEIRQRNFILRDLIKILLLNNFENNIVMQPQIPQYYQYQPMLNNRQQYTRQSMPNINQYNIRQNIKPRNF